MARHARFYAALVLIAAWFTLAMLSVLPAQAATECGRASWYGWEAGTHTANGERWNPNGMTAAHKTLPFGLMVRVTRTDTGQSVVVRLNDRGPFIPGRIIDLSRAAAVAIDMIGPGVVPVCITILN